MTIVKDPDIRFGKPTIEGTRITVGDVAERFYKQGRSSDEIAESLDLEVEQVEEALRYYHNDILEADVSDTGAEA
ncbi:MAG: DUF433 domain-containing protein [Candidatus Nanohaloarchaea archaeon]